MGQPGPSRGRLCRDTIRICWGSVREEDAVGGLPDGDFGDVAQFEFAGAGSVVLDGEVAEALVAVGVDELEVAGDVGVEGGVEEADGGGGGELEGADFAGVGDDGEEALRSWALSRRRGRRDEFWSRWRAGGR